MFFVLIKVNVRFRISRFKVISYRVSFRDRVGVCVMVRVRVCVKDRVTIRVGVDAYNFIYASPIGYIA